MPTRATPSTSANSPHRIASCGVRGARCSMPGAKLRRRQRTTVELAVRRQRQPIQHHDRRRHHVVRQHLRQRRTKPDSINHGPKAAATYRRTLAATDIADQPPARRAPSSRATTTACDTPPAAAARPRSRQAQSGSRAASPARPPAPGTPAPRPPRHRARSPVRYIRLARHTHAARHAGRRQTAPTSDPNAVR